MINVKDATQAAVRSYSWLYDNQLSPSAIQLEEVELTEDGKYWLVTLSYPIASQNPVLLSRREYKVFRIDAETGELQGMKIREVA